MKKAIAFVVCVFLVAAASAQSKHEAKLIARTYLLSHTVFGTKDSLALEDLFAREATYGHSNGNLQTRRQALLSISKNTSKYEDTAVSNVQVLMGDDMAIVRHLFKAKEIKEDGKIVPLNFAMMLVWVKEKKQWRLMGRQAVRLN